MTTEAAQPAEIRLRRAAGVLEVDYQDGFQAVLQAEYLRVESPSAEVRGHSPAERKWVPGKRGVAIEAVEAVGRYALRVRFSDGHDTGIYTWVFLRTLAEEQEARWAAYLAALEERGLKRD